MTADLICVSLDDGQIAMRLWPNQRNVSKACNNFDFNTISSVTLLLWRFKMDNPRNHLVIGYDVKKVAKHGFNFSSLCMCVYACVRMCLSETILKQLFGFQWHFGLLCSFIDRTPQTTRGHRTLVWEIDQVFQSFSWTRKDWNQSLDCRQSD